MVALVEDAAFGASRSSLLVRVVQLFHRSGFVDCSARCAVAAPPAVLLRACIDASAQLTGDLLAHCLLLVQTLVNAALALLICRHLQTFLLCEQARHLVDLGLVSVLIADELLVLLQDVHVSHVHEVHLTADHDVVVAGCLVVDARLLARLAAVLVHIVPLLLLLHLIIALRRRNVDGHVSRDTLRAVIRHEITLLDVVMVE